MNDPSNDDYLWDGNGAPDPEVARLERTLRELRFDAFAHPLRSRPEIPQSRISRWPLRIFAAAASLLIAIVGVVWFTWRPTQATWQVSVIQGTPVTTQQLEENRTLPVGDSLETDSTTRARIDIADVGRIDVEPGSRLELLSASAGNQRMRLTRGTVHAFIWAPAGQFFIETPSSTAVDLGCAYTLHVDERGNGLIEVTSGWVGFEWRGHESLIPSGSLCATRPNLGPGTPYLIDAPQAYRSNLALLDFAKASKEERHAALVTVLNESRKEDVVTLWHLLSRVDASERDYVFDRLATFVPPPRDVTRDGIRTGDRVMLDLWWDQLGVGSSALWRAWKREWRQ